MKQALKIGFASALALLAAISNANAFAHASAFVEWSVQSADADVSANLLGVKYHLLSNTNTGQAGGVYNFYFDDSYVSTDGNATASSGVFACDTIIKNWLRIQNSSTTATETLVLDVTTLAEVQT